MASLRWNPPPPPRQSTAVYQWAAKSDDGFHYSALQHNGATLRGGTEFPARPWTEYALNEVNLAEVYAEDFRRRESHDAAFRSTAITYNREMQRAISSRVWDWPRRTRRASGAVVGSPRDIVDTGELRRSQTLEFER